MKYCVACLLVAIGYLPVSLGAAEITANDQTILALHADGRRGESNLTVYNGLLWVKIDGTSFGQDCNNTWVLVDSISFPAQASLLVSAYISGKKIAVTVNTDDKINTYCFAAKIKLPE